MKEMGTGRTRFGRLAAVTVPATAASVALGFAIVQGMVSATLSSAGGFQLGGSKAVADNLQLTLNTADSATSASNAAVQQKEAAYASLTGTKVTGMCLAANQDFGTFGVIGVNIKTGAAEITDVGTIDLNAKSITTTGTAKLPKTEVGIAANQTGQTGVAAPGGFGMRTLNYATGTSGAPAVAGAVDLTGLKSTAYALTLNNGLTLTTLNVTPALGAVGSTPATC